jgi:glutaconate CoA-transferase subunit B
VRAAWRFRLESLLPCQSLEAVIAAYGFDFDHEPEPAVKPAPDAASLALIRGPVGRAVGETYPAFARKLLGDRTG